VIAFTEHVYLLGIWQGAWSGEPEDVLAEQVGRGVRVPVGMGITLPARRITEILRLSSHEQERADCARQYRDQLAEDKE
jgi:hypothetical protein